MSGLYWLSGVTLTSKSDKLEEMCGCPPEGIGFKGSLNTLGIEVCVGTIGSKDVVKTRDASGLHSNTRLTSYST